MSDYDAQKTLVARTTQIRKHRVAPYSGQVSQAERVHQRVVQLTRLELKAGAGDNNAVVNQRLRGDTFNFYSCNSSLILTLMYDCHVFCDKTL